MSVKAVVDELMRMAIKVEGTERIAQVATISANGETDVGNLLAKAMEKVTKDGVITIREYSPFFFTSLKYAPPPQWKNVVERFLSRVHCCT